MKRPKGEPMAKSIIIIGAGMGGLAAGIYGQINGYETRIFEMHTKPGGQCASWKRKGYTFDACIHHFFGCKPGSSLYRLWHELGAMPREMVALEDCTAVASPDGKMFVDYYDPREAERRLAQALPRIKGDRTIFGSIDHFPQIHRHDPRRFVPRDRASPFDALRNWPS
jgi:phytoene dehydrogenase-like protein